MSEHAPILIDRAAVEQVESFKFLGVHITKKLSWSKHINNLLELPLLDNCHQLTLISITQQTKKYY